MLKSIIQTAKFANGIRNLNSATDEAEKTKAAQYILEICGRDGGILTKIIQMLGTNESQVEELKKWQNESERTMELDLVKELIETRLNISINDHFNQITELSFTASLGQVNKAILKNGEVVAVKVQYPSIREKIHDQLKMLNLIGVVENSKTLNKWNISIKEYLNGVQTHLESELNYKNEVMALQDFYKAYSPYSFIKIPYIYDQYISETCYIQEFLTGDNIDFVIENWSANEKKILAQNLIRFFLISLFNTKKLQLDTNHYNFIFNKESNTIGIIDLGQTLCITDEKSAALKFIINETVIGRQIDMFDQMLILDFNKEKLSKIRPQLNKLLNIILLPFTKNQDFDLKTWNYKSEIDQILSEDKWIFRSSGGLFFFEVMKSFYGIKNLIERLDVKINYHQIWQDFRTNS